MAWLSSETDINCEDHSGLAFEEAFQALFSKPAERCAAPFMFPFCLPLERALGRSSRDQVSIDLGHKALQINFCMFFFFFFFGYRHLRAIVFP